MAKKFKLVYEDNGTIKGSYSGIPSKNDPELIDRAALEGLEPAPVPEPTGSIEITENGEYDVKKFASAKVNVGEEPDPEPIDWETEWRIINDFRSCLEVVAFGGTNVNETFEFTNCPYIWLEEIWTSFDTEAINRFIICLPAGPEEETAGKLQIKDNLTFKLNLKSHIGEAEATSENSFDFLNNGIFVETDAETGDSRIRLDDSLITFSGTIQVIYDASWEPVEE